MVAKVVWGAICEIHSPTSFSLFIFFTKQFPCISKRSPFISTPFACPNHLPHFVPKIIAEMPRLKRARCSYRWNGKQGQCPYFKQIIYGAQKPLHTENAFTRMVYNPRKGKKRVETQSWVSLKPRKTFEICWNISRIFYCIVDLPNDSQVNVPHRRIKCARALASLVSSSKFKITLVDKTVQNYPNKNLQKIPIPRKINFGGAEGKFALQFPLARGWNLLTNACN